MSPQATKAAGAVSACGSGQTDARLALPPALAPEERTSALVKAHAALSRAESLGAEPRAPLSASEKVCSEVAKFELRRLLRDEGTSRSCTPSTVFLHSEHVVPAPDAGAFTVNFLAEARNADGDFIVLSDSGWSVHRHGPAFSSVQVQLRPALEFWGSTLCSLDAFVEDVRALEDDWPALALGLKPRSLALEEALRAISRYRGAPRGVEASSLSGIAVLFLDGGAAEIQVSTTCYGRFKVRIELDTGRMRLSSSAISV